MKHDHSFKKSAVAFLLAGGLISPAMMSMSVPVLARTQSVSFDERKIFSGRIIWVGDSRFVGQSQYAKDNNDTYIAKVSMGYNWFNSSAVGQVNAVKQAGDTIIVNIGVNDMNSSALCSRLNQLAESDWKDCNVIFMSVNPVNDSKAAAHGYMVRNAQVVAFNNYMKQHLSSSIQYMNTFSVINDNSYNYTSDGVHYTPDGYRAIYNKAKSSLPTNKTTIAQVQFSNTYSDGKTVRYTLNKTAIKVSGNGKSEVRSQPLSDAQWNELISAIKTLKTDLDNSSALDTINKYTNFRLYTPKKDDSEKDINLGDNISDIVNSALSKVQNSTKNSDIEKYIITTGGKQYVIYSDKAPTVDGKPIGTSKLSDTDFTKIGDLADKIEKDPTNTDNIKSLLSLIGVSDVMTGTTHGQSDGNTNDLSSTSSSTTSSASVSIKKVSSSTDNASPKSDKEQEDPKEDEKSNGVGGATDDTKENTKEDAADKQTDPKANDPKANDQKEDGKDTESDSTGNKKNDTKSVDDISATDKDIDDKDDIKKDGSENEEKDAKENDQNNDQKGDSSKADASASSSPSSSTQQPASNSSSNPNSSTANQAASDRSTGVLSYAGVLIGSGSIGTVLTAFGIHQANKKKWYM